MDRGAMTNRNRARVEARRRFGALTVAEADRVLGGAPILALPDEPPLALIRRAVASPARVEGR
jgi:hypothetical protein